MVMEHLVGGNPAGVSTRSVLMPARELTHETLMHLKLSVMEQTERRAREEKPHQRLVTRMLDAQDLGLSNKEFTETSGSHNAWEDTSIADNTIADDTWIGIWGVRLHSPGTTDDDDASLAAMENIQYPISALRFVVGGARIAIWSLYPIWKAQIDLAESQIFDPPLGVAMSPIVIGPNKSITISEYTVVATTLYPLSFEGVVVEEEGSNLRP